MEELKKESRSERIIASGPSSLMIEDETEMTDDDAPRSSSSSSSSSAALSAASSKSEKEVHIPTPEEDAVPMKNATVVSFERDLADLRTSIRMLKETNALLQEIVDEGEEDEETGERNKTAAPDPEYLDAIEENVVVIAKKQMRIASIKQTVLEQLGLLLSDDPLDLPDEQEGVFL